MLSQDHLKHMLIPFDIEKLQSPHANFPELIQYLRLARSSILPNSNGTESKYRYTLESQYWRINKLLFKKEVSN